MIDAAAMLPTGDAMAGLGGGALADSTLALGSRSGILIFALIVGITALIVRWFVKDVRSARARRAHMDHMRGTGRYSDVGRSSPRRTGNHHADEHMRRARELHDLGHCDRALGEIDRAIALEPRSANLHLVRASELHELGRGEEALGAFGEASSLDPGEPYAYMGAGVIMHDLGRYEDALDLFEHAIEMDPSNADFYMGVGRVLLTTGHHEDAVEAFEHAISLNPSDSNARTWHERALDAMDGKGETRRLSDGATGGDTGQNA